MALTDYQAETLVAQVPFLKRICMLLGAICQNIESESTATALHAQRARLAGMIVTSMPQGAPWTSSYVADFAAEVVTQITLATTNLITADGVTNGDVDTTDSALSTILSSIYNTFITS